MIAPAKTPPRRSADAVVRRRVEAVEVLRGAVGVLRPHIGETRLAPQVPEMLYRADVSHNHRLKLQPSCRIMEILNVVDIDEGHRELGVQAREKVV